MKQRIPVIYVAGPFRHPWKHMPGQQDCWEIQNNIMVAAALALELWRMGAAALCPHLNMAYFQNAADDQVWLDGDLALLARCDAILMTPNWKGSAGARAEHKEAQIRYIKVLYNVDEARTFIAECKGEPHSGRVC